MRFEVTVLGVVYSQLLNAWYSHNDEYLAYYLGLTEYSINWMWWLSTGRQRTRIYHIIERFFVQEHASYIYIYI